MRAANTKTRRLLAMTVQGKMVRKESKERSTMKKNKRWVQRQSKTIMDPGKGKDEKIRVLEYMMAMRRGVLDWKKETVYLPLR